MSKKKGIVLSGPDKGIEAKAKNLGLGVTIDPELPMAFPKTLFVEPGTRVPWDLLSAAWHFLERWDAVDLVEAEALKPLLERRGQDFPPERERGARVSGTPEEMAQAVADALRQRVGR